MVDGKTRDFNTYGAKMREGFGKAFKERYEKAQLASKALLAKVVKSITFIQVASAFELYIST
jgi:hypothetical protein